jgi:hypothetical protein
VHLPNTRRGKMKNKDNNWREKEIRKSREREERGDAAESLEKLN